jgi:hypothetical protein
MTVTITVEYDVIPGQAQTLEDPGWTPYIEITSCKLEGKEMDVRDSSFWDSLSDAIQAHIGEANEP